MKLKKKLAKEYSKTMCGEKLKEYPVLNAHISEYMSDAFQAGFEKARQMALEHSKNMADHSCELHTAIRELGEEETE